MSRIVAPLLSFSASGQIAKTQVYSTWKGRPYVRRYAIPSNPKTADQMETRNTFSWLNNVWKFMPATAIDAWTAYANSSRFTNRNGFIKRNLSDLRSEPDLANFIFSPSASGGLAAAAMALTPAANQITVALTAPPLPTGWTITGATAAAIVDQDPQSGTLYTVVAAVDAAAPWSIILAGLTAATD